MKQIKVNLIEDNIIKESIIKKCHLGLFDILVSKKIIKKVYNKQKLKDNKIKYIINCSSYTEYLYMLSKLK